jgi:hypothetical protein
VPRASRTHLDLARESAELWADEDREQNIAYLSRTFTLTSLPYQRPADDVLVWHRRNGNFLLKITPGAKVENGVGVPIGFPYGTIPRLLAAYVATEAVKSRTPEIELPNSLAKFMGALGMKATGGKNGTITRLRDQAERFFEATFTVRYDGDSQRDAGAKFVREWDLNWNPKKGAVGYITLSTEFFNEIISGPVPLDLDAFLALGGSPLRMDIYVWLTYRMSRLTHPVTVPWDSLQGQFGVQLANDRKGRSKFKALFIEHLRYVLTIYRDARVEVTDTGLLLRRSPTHVLPRGLRALKSSAS